MKFTAYFLVAAALITSFVASANEAELNIGRIAGAYVLSADFQQQLARSECRYAYRKTPVSPGTRISEVLATVPQANRIEAKRFFEDSADYKEMRASITKLITDILDKTRAEGLDRNTACGMLIAFAATNEAKAASMWTAYAKNTASRQG